jgi:serine-type D-Ala-D-Ala carboxypeptidase
MRDVVRLVDAVVTGGRIPSASIAVRAEGRVLLHHTAGALGDPPYDLASLTKPLAGATVAADLVQRGVLDLGAPAARWAPGVDPRIEVGHLLDHASGLPAWAPLHERCVGRRAIVEAACSTPPAHTPGAAHLYSDLGFLALLAVLEAAGGDRLDVLLAPLLRAAAVDLRWGWPGARPTGAPDGSVHDPIARAMGGVSAHAGLFGTALGVSALVEALLDAAAGRRDDLPGAGMRALWARRGPGTHRGGWDSVSPQGSSSGRHWPPDGVGHVGFTGTSVWIAPRQRGVVAFLTNRVVADVDLTAIRAARPAVHEAVARALGWDTLRR